ncbi:MAG: hypothetical protein K8S16_06840 [Bacteroidales bacterium]|nr:hypothetical protein [Bacteroidales bacterium]
MKKIVFQILIIFPLTICSQIIDENSYEKEVEKFYLDIFNDSYQYTKNDFQKDSINLEIDEFLVKIGIDQYDDLRIKIDTTDSKYMIRTHSGKKHFDTLYLQANFISYRSVRLYKFLMQDSLHSIINPFNQHDIEENLSLYWKMRCKLNPADFFIDAVFISECEISMYYEMADGWIDLLQNYGDYIGITLPIFDTNGDFAYFEWEYNCGNLCGSGYSAFYKKVNGKWKPIIVWNTWIS